MPRSCAIVGLRQVYTRLSASASRAYGRRLWAGSTVRAFALHGTSAVALEDLSLVALVALPASPLVNLVALVALVARPSRVRSERAVGGVAPAAFAARPTVCVKQVQDACVRQDEAGAAGLRCSLSFLPHFLKFLFPQY
jgi:hypothetical protein